MELGPEHPYTAEVRSWVSAVLVARGRFADAEPLLLASERVLGWEGRYSIHQAIRANLVGYYTAAEAAAVRTVYAGPAVSGVTTATRCFRPRKIASMRY